MPRLPTPAYNGLTNRRRSRGSWVTSETPALTSFFRGLRVLRFQRSLGHSWFPRFRLTNSLKAPGLLLSLSTSKLHDEREETPVSERPLCQPEKFNPALSKNFWSHFLFSLCGGMNRVFVRKGSNFCKISSDRAKEYMLVTLKSWVPWETQSRVRT